MNRHIRSICIIAVILALVIGIVAPVSLAQEGNTADTSQKSFLDEGEKQVTADFPSMGKALTRLVGVMVLLFALLLGGLVLFQRLSRRGLKLGGESRPLRVMDRISLGPKSSVCLLQTCGKTLVLGISEKEITVLMDMDMAPQGGQQPDFAGTMKQASENSPTASGQSPV